MKILYIAHYREFGGWANAAKDQILALDAAGVDVVCRHVTLTSDRQDIHPRLKELEKKSAEGCNICIQHVLPHHLAGSKAFDKNIAFLEAESLSIKHLPWFRHLQMMDEIWVANETLKKSLVKDDIGVPVSVVHHATDVDKYKKKYKDIKIDHIHNTFRFYYIGDMNDRKNIASIVRCFHSEFDRSENVSLTLKVKKFGKSPEELHKELNDVLSKEKAALRLYPSLEMYKKEAVITSESSDEDLYALHQYGHCFVLPSHGEAWSIPALDAVGFGSTPICSNDGGPKEFIDKDNNLTGTLVDGVWSCCKCSDAAFPDIFTGREYWFQPCEKQIRDAMRAYYRNWSATKNNEAGLKQVEQFSYENIGKKMLEVLK
jgi:glycosyltransferase involved in cell wall biosynthesis